MTDQPTPPRTSGKRTRDTEDREPPRASVAEVKRRLTPYRKSLLDADNVLARSFPVLTRRNTDNAMKLARIEPWRFRNLPPGAAVSIGALVFDESLQRVHRPLALRTFARSFNSLNLPEFATLFYQLAGNVRTDNWTAFAEALVTLLLAHFPATPALVAAVRTYAALLEDEVVLDDHPARYNAAADAVIERLSEFDDVLGTSRFFEQKDFAFYTKQLIVAFASPKDRAALCSTDKFFAELCRISRGHLAEYRFYALFQDTRRMPNVRVETLLRLNYTMFDQTVTWPDFHRAAVSADEVVQSLKSIGTLQLPADVEHETDLAFRRFKVDFGNTRGNERAALLPRELRPHGVTREDRRYQTSRLVMWMLHERGGAERALAAAFFLRFFHMDWSPYDTMPLSDLVHADGTVYDGRMVFKALEDVGMPDRMWALIESDRCSVELMRLLYSQNSALAFWSTRPLQDSLRKMLTLNTALRERADITPAQHETFTQRIVTALVRTFSTVAFDANGSVFEQVSEYAKEHTAVDIWLPVLLELEGDGVDVQARVNLLIVYRGLIDHAALGEQRRTVLNQLAMQLAKLLTSLRDNALQTTAAAQEVWSLQYPPVVWALALAQVTLASSAVAYETCVALEENFLGGQQQEAQALVRDYIAFYEALEEKKQAKRDHFITRVQNASQQEQPASTSDN